MEQEFLPQLHTLAIVGARTALSRSALYREIKAGRLRTVKIGRALRVSENELSRFIACVENGGADES